MRPRGGGTGKGEHRDCRQGGVLFWDEEGVDCHGWFQGVFEGVLVFPEMEIRRRRRRVTDERLLLTHLLAGISGQS